MSKTDNPKPKTQKAESAAEQPRPELIPDELLQAESVKASTNMPTMEPPEAGIFANAGENANAWFDSKKINSIWVSNNNKNAYVHVVGIGWIKLNDANANSLLAMYMIAASARQGNNNVNYRKENDNKIHEIYSW